MRRREFITLLGGAAFPIAARAQQTPAIGFLDTGVPDGPRDRAGAFQQGLRGAGYIAGQNVAIDYRWAGHQLDRLPALAADLVDRKVSVIVANGAAALEAKAATTTIPIVFYSSGDPIETGLVASLSRPAGNLTGVTAMTVELSPKRLELLHQLVPKTTTISLLINPTNPNADAIRRDHQASARALGLQVHVVHASTARHLDTVFASLAQARAGALVIGSDSFFSNRSEHLALLTLRHGIPAIHYTREFAAAGGLMSYGGSLKEAYRLVGLYAGRILAGAKPADLPVQQSTKFELIINARTAKALGLTVTPALLGRADEVIE
jgi:putative tryptophan/tyrosine transport system substrate-binding protein